MLFLNMTKLLNYLADHLVISDVHGMIIFCNVTQKVRRDWNKINNSAILEVSIVSFHARI